jgi:hypothetical protein
MPIHDYYFQRDQLFALPPFLVDLQPEVSKKLFLPLFAHHFNFFRNTYHLLLVVTAPFLLALLLVNFAQ